MKLQDKLISIRYAKNIAIRKQNYEAAATLRDQEKSILNHFSSEEYKTFYNDITLDSFSIEQLNCLYTIMLDQFGSKEADVIKDIIQLRRQNKISDLLD